MEVYDNNVASKQTYAVFLQLKVYKKPFLNWTAVSPERRPLHTFLVFLDGR
jgi:hypothetical protein